MNKLYGYIEFSIKCFKLLSYSKFLFVLFLVAAPLGAFTEGLGVTLLVPILDIQSGESGFSNIPILHNILGLFDGLSSNDRIKFVAIIIALAVIFRGILQYTIDILGAIIPQKLQEKMIISNYDQIINSSINFINDKDYGTLMNGLLNWASRVSMMLTAFAQILWNTVVLVVYIFIMLAVSWRLTLAAVLFVLITSIVLRSFSHGPLRRAGIALSDANVTLSQIAIESLSGMKLIRLSAAENIMMSRFSKALRNLQLQSEHMARVNGLGGPFLTSAAGLFICVLLFGSAQVHENGSTTWISSLLLFLFLLMRLLGPVTSLNQARMRIAGERAAFDYLEKFCDEASQNRQLSGTREIHRFRESISFENVTFSYKEEDGEIIHDLTTTIPHGRMTAVVGPSGAGKSTLIALLARLYDPQHGRILVDGIDLKEFNVSLWRKRLAVVSQDTFIFNDTVANNIRFGQADLDFEKIQRAANLAAADGFISELPQGYDTLLGERGVRLSGGQQQRIAIARAILADPDLLILDEATSNLDSFTERAIQDAVDQLSKERTLLVIAHRLSTIRKADNVIVLKDGYVVEEGRHEELLLRNGIYKEMVDFQRLDLIDDNADNGIA